MYPYDVTFHPGWWNKYAGVEFDEKFFFDENYRMETDVTMRRLLYSLFGDLGIGEKDPQPRPILFSDLIASGFLYSELLGCKVLYTKDDAPQVLPANLSEDEVQLLNAPDLDRHPLWQKVQRQADAMKARFGYVESAVNLMGIQNIALDLRGQDLFLDYYDDEELSEKLLSVVTDLSLDIGKRLSSLSPVLSGGVTAITKQVLPRVYLTSNCSVTMISNGTYCEHLLPWDKKLAKAFPCFGIHHCGNNMENVIDGYLQIPELKFLEIGYGSDLSKIASALSRHGREDMLCCIRYSPAKLKTASSDEIRRETEDAIRAFGNTASLSFSCVGIDKDVPHENVRAYLSVFA